MALKEREEVNSEFTVEVGLNMMGEGYEEPSED